MRRPDVCIGTDPVHTPAAVVDAIAARCGDLGWTVAVDAPYAGTLVPSRYLSRVARVASVMIEVNRRLYLADEPRDVTRGTGFEQVRRAVRGLVACARAAIAW